MSKLETLSKQVNQEIDEQTERLIKSIEGKNVEEIKEEYKKIVQILIKKLAVETKFIEQKIAQENLSEDERELLMQEKKKLIEDFQKTAITLARQIDGIIDKTK